MTHKHPAGNLRGPKQEQEINPVGYHPDSLGYKVKRYWFCHDFCTFLAKIPPKPRLLIHFTAGFHPWLLLFYPFRVLLLRLTLSANVSH